MAQLSKGLFFERRISDIRTRHSHGRHFRARFFSGSLPGVRFSDIFYMSWDLSRLLKVFNELWSHFVTPKPIVVDQNFYQTIFNKRRKPENIAKAATRSRSESFVFRKYISNINALLCYLILIFEFGAFPGWRVWISNTKHLSSQCLGRLSPSSLDYRNLGKRFSAQDSDGDFWIANVPLRAWQKRQKGL